MNRARSVTVFGHTSTGRHADGEGDEPLFQFSICPLLPLWDRSVSLSLSLGSHNLIIILSAARARLIGVPLDCLLQADDLTKAFCST